MPQVQGATVMGRWNTFYSSIRQWESNYKYQSGLVVAGKHDGTELGLHN